MLVDWGMEGIEDSFAYYEIQAIYCGGQIVKAVLNPDHLGRRPYFCTSYIKQPGSLWGKAIPLLMMDCQIAINTNCRNLLNNQGIASGPQTIVDIDSLDPMIDPTDMFPWKVWQVHREGYNGRSLKPVDQFQPVDNSEKIMAIVNFFEGKIDDRTMIPRYAHGDGNMGGAGDTASGMSMLMNSAFKGIKQVISNIDEDIIKPMIERLYHWNLVYLDDEKYGALKGDCRAVARGALTTLIREQIQQRRQAFADSAGANPIFQQIIGMKGFRTLLAAIAEGLDLPKDSVVPSEQEMLAQMQGPQGNQPPTQPGASNALPAPGTPSGPPQLPAPGQNTPESAPMPPGMPPAQSSAQAAPALPVQVPGGAQ